jgi:thiol-disulfide isomerase/thioredoxin
LLNFRATWCEPCIAELPNLIEAANKFAYDGDDGEAIDSAARPNAG